MVIATKIKFIFPLCVLLHCCFVGCTNTVSKDEDASTSTMTYGSEKEDQDECRFPDDTYNATVDYYNPETGYSRTYNLDVEVSDCQVIQINFSNGGYLDDSHIDPAELDDEGNATIEDDRGRTFEVQIQY